ncbi:MAG: type II toxin-antitoxin system VapC family toxin [Kiloniellaceae bacterium]
MTGWLLDTNIVSELARPAGNARVVAWAEAQPEERFYISVLTLAEYDKGIANLPSEAPNRPRLEAAVAALEVRFAGRVLALSDHVVRRWGRISGTVKLKIGRSPPVIDTLLAATAIEHDLHLATPNVRGVAESGASVFNPWEDDPARFKIG